ncbi:MAG: 4Fe-4S dicluster domain-containing protein [Planctomycetes bacterium]|nr:4Fe-4S dicluster domain-containing protein [Planctomycetota bacterium]
MGHLAIDAVRCKGCGLCIDACPRGLIKKSGKLNERGYEFVVLQQDAGQCSGCTMCAVSCPDQGIEVWNDRGRQSFVTTSGLTEKMTHYCPGCTHGVIHRIVAEVLQELGVMGRTIGVAPVGCAVLAYEYFSCDMFEAAHGRAPAVATGAKRARPNSIVWTYQGDGDLASIGGNEILHAANRGERITVIFVNNAVYGMTGGQMAPTTLLGQKTTTSPFGRDAATSGHPLRVSELLASLGTPAYIARGSVHDGAHVLKTKKLIKRAFELQRDDRCFSMIEVLSTCPTNWGLSPCEATEWLEKNMIPAYPLGVVKDSFAPPSHVPTAPISVPTGGV